VSPTQPEKIDPPSCRNDLVKLAAASDFKPDFDWINDKEALRMSSDPANRGLTANEIRELARDWINEGEAIDCVKETRPSYCVRRHFHYDIIIFPLDGFPKGLLVYMELCQKGQDDPSVNLLNAHPPSF
jgi:hypothetical protein